MELLILFITSRCNLNCNACFYKSSLNNKSDMSFLQISKIINNIPHTKAVLITGGEPFLNEDIFSILQLLIKNYTISVNTNGFLTTKIKEVIEKLLDGNPKNNVYVYVSIDGSEITHNSMRKNNLSYMKAIDTLRLLTAIRNKYCRLKVCVSSIISPQNYMEIVSLASELYSEFKPDYYDFEVERSNEETKNYFKANFEALNSVFKAIFKFLLNNYTDMYPSESRRYKTQYENLLNNKNWDFPCCAGKEAAVVYPDGNLAACEIRSEKINLSDYNYDINKAINSELMINEIKKINDERCFCTHGCWVQTSLQKYYNDRAGNNYKNARKLMMRELYGSERLKFYFKKIIKKINGLLIKR